jgi:hypothetical protein
MNNDQESDALDLFKKCHYSKKKNGYTSTVQLANERHLCTMFLKLVFLVLPCDHTMFLLAC